jgi:hypothetical protein
MYVLNLFIYCVCVFLGFPFTFKINKYSQFFSFSKFLKISYSFISICFSMFICLLIYLIIIVFFVIYGCGLNVWIRTPPHKRLKWS